MLFIGSVPFFFFSFLKGASLPESVGVSAKVLVERSIQPYKLPIDPNLFEYVCSKLYHLYNYS